MPSVSKSSWNRVDLEASVTIGSFCVVRSQLRKAGREVV